MKQETKESILAAHIRGEEYDESAGELFLNKEIVAPIIKMVVPEYAGMSVYDVIGHMETDIVNTALVEDIPIRMEGLPTEMKSVSEKLIRYDTHFKMRNPKLSSPDIAVLLHIDIEVQGSYRPSNPSYPIIMRALYYAARELSSQLGRITAVTDYGRLEKVYSIWVCNSDVPVKEENTVSSYAITKNDMIGVCDEDESLYDLLSVIIIRRGRTAGKEDIFTYLEAVFSSDIVTMQRYSDVEWSEELKKEVQTMSGLGEALYMKGEKQGFRQGEELFAKLSRILLEKKAYDELALASSDETVRKEMYRKYGIIE